MQLPIAAIATGFVLVAVPVLILMVIWTLVTMWRVVFPDDELPFDKGIGREIAKRRGQPVPVQLADIMEEQRHHPVWPVMPMRQRVEAEIEEGGRNPLQEDLWRRRN
ncbi:hypothetical protein [Rubricoccus marinus]|uniref:Uncharacterized protein n=1 Tax=Rubricoccus marinus TaxID=716817 RepID=A0A259TZV7_9BACT|nr:hypothetical protein [Rubricoccus marinus]OZC03230.1 hypothetical protein BSZ36_09735 [Rubricoccus marinus]